MPYVDWSDEFSVGLEEIDAQHHILVDCLNRLHDAIHERKSQDEVVAVLGALGDYTRIHFAVEESLMRVFEYPDYPAHKAEHEKLLAQFVEKAEKCRSGRVSANLELLQFLRSWLTDHIIHGDKKYAPIFLSRGMKASSSAEERKPKGWFARLWS